MKALIVTLLLALLTGCSTAALEATLGVEGDENAVMCTNVTVDRPLSESTASYRRAEIPRDVDFTALTPEQIRALFDC